MHVVLEPHFEDFEIPNMTFENVSQTCLQTLSVGSVPAQSPYPARLQIAKTFFFAIFPKTTQIFFYKLFSVAFGDISEIANMRAPQVHAECTG